MIPGAVKNRTLALINTHFAVKATGLPNYKSAKIPLPTSFNFPFLEKQLKDYHDKDVIQFLKFGFPVDCTPVDPDPGMPANHKGAIEFKREVESALHQEVLKGGCLGPFMSSPFTSPRFSPLNSVAKRESNDRRLILDLSFPRGQSINDGIDKDSYLGIEEKLTLPSLDKLVTRIMQLGVYCKLYKVDLARGYKQIYICPLDIEKMGFTSDGRMFFDCTLSMGSRSSARCCQRVTNAIVYIYTKWGYFAINYLDDIGGAEQEHKADEAFAILRKLLVDFGLAEARNKSCAPAHVMVFLGIEVNSILLTLRIPEGKLCEILNLLESWESKVVATRKEVQQLAGSLNFVARCVRSGRVYLSRILNFLRGLPLTGKVKVDREVQKDIKWWKEFFPLYNGVSMMLYNEWGVPDEQIASDSCLTGGGACTSRYFIHFEFPQWVIDRCKYINELECVTLVVAVAKWAHLFPRSRIQLNCDNQVTVVSINSGSSRNQVLQSCLRYLHKIMALENIDVKAVYLTSRQNRVCDLLSRWHLHPKYSRQFNEINSELGMREQQVSEVDFHFLEF